MMTSSHQSHNTTSFKPRRIKTTTTTAGKPPQPPEKQPVLKCPRCDSVNTKFCYYNNYSLSQPRHYCKNCRRYWTRGGSLRNVPIGGSTRNKNKPPPPPPPPSCITTHVTPHSNMTSSFSGYMFPLAPNSYYNLLGASSSSIESLSSLNQDLHQKLQQQRLITTFQDSLPVNDKPVMFINPPSTMEWDFDRSAIGGGGGGEATSGSIENNGEDEGNFGNWYHNANHALL